MVESTRRGQSSRLAPTLALVAALALAGLARPAAAQVRGQQSYAVSEFAIEYPLPHPDHPPVRELLDLEVEMRPTRGGLMQPHPATENARFRLGQVPPGARFWTSGLQHVTQTLVAEFTRRGIGAVVVTLPDIEEGTGRDLRAPAERRLRVRIWTGRIENIATLADGDRFSGEPAERTNLAAHRFVRDGSPVRAGGEDELVRTREIERYTQRLSRHPGRRVDAVFEPGELPGTTRLVYHVAEQKPWLAYAQLTNNGTDATTEWRERFGFSHTQLTGHDDVLRLDYVTGDFDDVHAGFGSYEFPIWKLDRLRLRAYGGYSEYDASEVGVARLDYSGDEWEAGGRLVANVLQLGAFFVDVWGGARWQRIGVENEFTFVGESALRGEEEEDFFLPEAGLSAVYRGLSSQLYFDAGVEWNVPGVAGTETSRLINLGRVEPDAYFEVARWNGSYSFYLEPILLYRRGWGDPGAPSRSTLAHEVMLATRGQWSFDDRLVPQLQQVMGGLYTVRGYEQSVAAGDGALIGSAEYRLHLARLLDPGGEPIELPVVGPFQVWPRTVFARPDWDVVLKAFVDGGRTYETRTDEPNAVNQAEDPETLWAYGVGAELQFMRYLRAGIDVAWPQRELSDGREGSDDPQLHVVVTVMF